MFMRSWNKKVVTGVALIIVQVIIFMAILGRENATFNLPAFVICSIPGIIGVFLIMIEKARGRY